MTRRARLLRSTRFLTVALTLAIPVAALLAASGPPPPAAVRFEVTVGAGLLPGPTRGRLLVVLGKDADPEPRTTLTETGLESPVTLGADATLSAGGKATVGPSAVTFPIASLGKLPPGEYHAQAVFAHNPDLRLPSAPGNLVGPVVRVRIDPKKADVVRLNLTRRLPDETLPADDENVKFLKFRSEALSRFHGRPMYLRAGVILPRGHATDRGRRYPLRVHIGGFGSRFTGVRGMMAEGTEHRRAWAAEDAPGFILLHLDGAGPLGDPYQVDSANHGPYGEAVTRELIPFAEKTYRGIGQGWARTLDGASTGGWVSLALQIFYPDFFNGAWSHCPDPVDFRSFELIDIYRDGNVYKNRHGFERPSARDLDGETRITVRLEVRREIVLGPGDRWELGGRDWGSWNATFGPRGKDGLPVPLWDGQTGQIDRAVADHYRKYDLRLKLEREWATLAPKLRGKLRVWVGEADEYFLNNAVRRLEEFQRGRKPPLEARLTFAPREGHDWRGLSEAQVLRQMAEAVERARPRD